MARRMFYVEPARQGMAEVRGETATHLRRVLRAEPGQRYEVSDNQSRYLAEITSLDKDRVEFRLLEPIPTQAAPVRLHLLAALVKFDRFEWILEKATELGVEKIMPVVASRSDHGLEEASRKRVDRWRRILFESAQQARRVSRPELAQVTNFSEALRCSADVRLWLDEQPGGQALLSALPEHRVSGQCVALLTGPEGGWADTERAAALAQGWSQVTLGPQILRAETAALAALAVVSAAWQVSASSVRTSPGHMAAS